MVNFLLEFEDLDPSLSDVQAADYETLDDAAADVVVAVRDIVADHVRNGRILTLASVVIKDDKSVALKEIKVSDILTHLLPATQPVDRIS